MLTCGWKNWRSWHPTEIAAIEPNAGTSMRTLVWMICGWVGMAWGGALSAAPIDCDLLLKGGVLHDGTGGAARVGDVAIRDGRIVGVGTFEAGRVGLVLPCTGLIVAPGFIDLHTHSDDSILDPRTRTNTNYVLQGCTTIVTGNCGSGPVDVGAFLEKIGKQGAGSNVAHLLPHGSIRDKVLGTEQRAATPDELARMAELVRAGMKEGAWGMSTGLIYVPSSYSDEEELVALTKVVAEHGGIYASHIRGEGTGLLKSIDEALRIGRESGAPVHVSHFKSSGRDAWGLIREAAKMIDAARAEGQTVTADQYPYVASSTSLEATLIPTWARAGGSKELIKRIDDDEQGPRIREAIADSLEGTLGGESVRIARFGPRPEWIGKNLVEIAKLEETTPLEIVLKISRMGGAAIVNFSMSEEDVRFAMTLPWVATASDGRGYLPGADKPHPRSYGTFSRKIGHYAIAESVVPLEQAIHSSSGLPAKILGLTDRGTLVDGAWGDVVVLDPQSFRDRATFDEPHRYSTGMRYVLVNGVPAVWEGQPTGALAGKVLRKNVADAFDDDEQK
jgi:N-acyl-D-amino-acid deacylase